MAIAKLNRHTGAPGAEITRAPQTQDYGGRDYTCKDSEGNVWTFGTYDPWAGH